MAESEDLRQFIRDIAARHERIWREQREEFRERRAESHAMLAGLREVQEGLREAREESRAQTQTLLHVLDRLGNGGAAA